MDVLNNENFGWVAVAAVVLFALYRNGFLGGILSGLKNAIPAYEAAKDESLVIGRDFVAAVKREAEFEHASELVDSVRNDLLASLKGSKAAPAEPPK